MVYFQVLGSVFAAITGIVLTVLLGTSLITLSWSPFDVTLWETDVRLLVTLLYGVAWLFVTATYFSAYVD